MALVWSSRFSVFFSFCRFFVFFLVFTSCAFAVLFLWAAVPPFLPFQFGSASTVVLGFLFVWGCFGFFVVPVFGSGLGFSSCQLTKFGHFLCQGTYQYKVLKRLAFVSNLLENFSVETASTFLIVCRVSIVISLGCGVEESSSLLWLLFFLNTALTAILGAFARSVHWDLCFELYYITALVIILLVSEARTYFFNISKYIMLCRAISLCIFGVPVSSLLSYSIHFEWFNPAHPRCGALSQVQGCQSSYLCFMNVM